jgi:hypothetical protein
VLALYGQGSGYSEQLIGDQGTAVPAGGLPNLTIGDLGTTPAVPEAAGGLLDSGLIHIAGDGSIQYAVEPEVSAITVTGPASTLRRGAREQLAAVGQPVHGDDAVSAPPVPITDPVARSWRSSDPHVIAVDPLTGAIRALAPGVATVTVASGGATGSVKLTVSGPRGHPWPGHHGHHGDHGHGGPSHHRGGTPHRRRRRIG